MQVLRYFKNSFPDLKYILNLWISKIYPVSNVYLITYL